MEKVSVQAVPLDRTVRKSADGNGWFMLLFGKEELRNHGYRADEVECTKSENEVLALPFGEAVALSVQPYVCPQVAAGEGISRAHGLTFICLYVSVFTNEEVLHQETLRVVV